MSSTNTVQQPPCPCDSYAVPFDMHSTINGEAVTTLPRRYREHSHDYDEDKKEMDEGGHSYSRPGNCGTQTTTAARVDENEENWHRFELKRLELIRMNIVNIPSYAWEPEAFKTLRELDLSRNELVRVPSVSALVNLRSLKLYYNRIQGWSDISQLAYNSKLAHLDLRMNPCSNRPGYIAYVLDHIPQVTVLDGVDVGCHQANQELRSRFCSRAFVTSEETLEANSEYDLSGCFEQPDNVLEETDVPGTAVVFGHNDFRVKCPVRVIIRGVQDSSHKSVHQRYSQRRRTYSSGSRTRNILVEKDDNVSVPPFEKEKPKSDYDDISSRVRTFRKIREEVIGLFSDTSVGRSSRKQQFGANQEMFPHWTNRDLLSLEHGESATKTTSQQGFSYMNDASSNFPSPNVHDSVQRGEDVRGLIRHWPGTGNSISPVENTTSELSHPPSVSLTKSQVCREFIPTHSVPQGSSLSVQRQAESETVESAPCQTAEKAVGPSAIPQREVDSSRINYLENKVTELNELLQSTEEQGGGQTETGDHKFSFLSKDRLVVPSRPLPRSDERQPTAADEFSEEDYHPHEPAEKPEGFTNWKEKYYYEEKLWRRNFLILKSHYEKAVRRLMNLQSDQVSGSSSSHVS